METELLFLLQSLHGEEGAMSLSITLIAVQFVHALLKKKYGERFSGIWKIGYVYGATLFLGVALLRFEGIDWKAALLHANTLAQAQVFGHQVLKQLKEKYNGRQNPSYRSQGAVHDPDGKSDLGVPQNGRWFLFRRKRAQNGNRNSR